MGIEDGVVDAFDAQRGRFVVRFGSGSYAAFEMLRQPGHEKSADRVAIGDTVRAAPDSVGKLVMLNMSRKLPMLVSGLTGAGSRDDCLRTMSE